MKIRVSSIAAALLCLSLSLSAQNTSSTATPATATVPRLIRFSGTLTNVVSDLGADGAVLVPGTAPTHVVAITFSLYAEQEGGAPLWSEVQNVHVDSGGRYTVQLGASKPDGLPTDIFTSVQAQWLGVQPQDHAEQPRVLLVSVPYALKAADAETFGGKPPSAYALAPLAETSLPGRGPTAVGNGGSHTQPNTPHPLPISGSGTTNYVPLWTNASNLSSSVIYQNPTLNYIGIGTTSPAAALEVDNETLFPILGLTHNSVVAAVGGFNHSTGGGAGVLGTSQGPAGIGVWGKATATSGQGFGVEGDNTTPNGAGVYGKNSGSAGDGVSGVSTATTGTAAGVFGSSASPSGSGVFGSNNASTGTPVGVTGQTNSPVGTGVVGFAEATTGSATGVEGLSASPDGIGVLGTSPGGVGVYGDNTSGYGVWGQSKTGVGIQGTCAPTGSNSCFNGIAGLNESTSGPANGVWALTESPQGNAVYMVNSGGGDLLFGTQSNGGNATFYVQGDGGGYFGGAVEINGDLNVTGNLNKGSGSFKIDDPLDPANKYLSHSFVESPDMMNIYNGNVTTDKRGLATVVLPNYFEALNRDFRYQLTVIGQFAQAIIAGEINRGRFTIRTNKPGVKVSWQVTGVRQDAWANAHRIPNEEEKPAAERGHYLHPELFGAPESKGIHNARAPRPDDTASVTEVGSIKRTGEMR